MKMISIPNFIEYNTAVIYKFPISNARNTTSVDTLATITAGPVLFPMVLKQMQDSKDIVSWIKKSPYDIIIYDYENNLFDDATNMKKITFNTKHGNKVVMWFNYNNVSGGINGVANGGVNGVANGANDANSGAKPNSEIIHSTTANYPKDKHFAAVLPATIMECSIIRTLDEPTTCMSDRIANKIITAHSASDIHEVKKITNCTTERCVIEAAHSKNIIDDAEKNRELILNFKVPGPTDVSLLSNVEIDEFLYQLEQTYNATHKEKFYHNKFIMCDIDSDKYMIGSIGGQNPLKFDFDAIKKQNYRWWGCVLNTDKCTGKGIHWMALFIDLKDSVIEFFNSSGNAPQPEYAKILNKLKEKLSARLDIIVPYRYQETQTECGVFAIFYIYCRLYGIPREKFKTSYISDKWMFEARQHIFAGKSGQPNFVGKKYDHKHFAAKVNILWEPY